MKQNRTGFSLIELLVVFIVMGILIAVLVPSLVKAKQAHAASMPTPVATPTAPSSAALTTEQIEQITRIIRHEISFIKPNVDPQVDDYDVESPVDVPKQKCNSVILNYVDGVWYYRSSSNNVLQKIDSNRKMFIFEDGKLVRSE